MGWVIPTLTLNEREVFKMIPRYLREYANATKKGIMENAFIRDEIKVQAVDRIDKVLHIREKGIITIDESILMIMNALAYVTK